MKFTLRLAVPALALALIAAGCGGDDNAVDSGTQDLAGARDMSASSDQGVTYDLAGVDFSGVGCGNQTCASGQQCCLTPNLDTKMVEGMCVAPGTACGDGGVPTTCDGPEDCTPAASNCCVSLALGNNAVSGSASCTASCPATASADNGGSLTTRLCHGPADCAGYNGTAPIVGNAAFDKCCTYTGLTFEFCAPALLPTLSNKVTCK